MQVNHLKKVAGYNDIPDELVSTVPELHEKKPLRVHFFAKNPVINAETNRIDEYLFEQNAHRLSTTIQDSTGKLYNIGCIAKWDKDRPITTHDLQPWAETAAFEKNGFIDLHARKFTKRGNISHEELATFLWLSDKNESKPGRNKNVVAEWRFEDKEATRKSQRNINDKVLDNLAYIRDIQSKEKEVKQIAAGLNIDINADMEDIILALQNKARNEPLEFEKIVASPLNKIKLEIKEAETKDIIEYRLNDKAVFFKGTDIKLCVVVENGIDWVDQASEALSTEVMKPHYDSMKKQLEQIKREEKKKNT